MASHAEHVETSNNVAPGASRAAAGTAFLGLVDEAKEATAQEHQMSLWQGIKLYPKAIGWSVLLSTAIIMEGYGQKTRDVQLKHCPDNLL
jgi:hypothetical protein